MHAKFIDITSFGRLRTLICFQCLSLMLVNSLPSRRLLKIVPTGRRSMSTSPVELGQVCMTVNGSALQPPVGRNLERKGDRGRNESTVSIVCQEIPSKELRMRLRLIPALD
jgi:hypothetical protein